MERRSPEGALTPDELHAELRNWRANGRPTRESAYRGVPVYRNEFWTSKQRAAHSLHEISYRACFKPQLPNFFLVRLTNPGDLVFDPFMGRGTTLLEAVLLQRDAIGNDVNPLARMLVEPRLDPPDPGSIDARLKSLDLEAEVEVPDGFEVFFESRTLREICNLRRYLLERERTGAVDGIDNWIRMTALNRLTGHSPGFFSVYTLPPNQATSIERQRKINHKRKQEPEYRDVRERILRKSRSLMRSRIDRQALGRAEGFLQHDLRHGIPYTGRRVRLSVTSPPFLNVVNYRADNWMRCWFAGIDPKQVNVTQTGSLPAWKDLVRRCLEAVARITEKGGYFAFEVGEVAGGNLFLDHVVVDVAKDTRWEPVLILVQEQEFTKTSNTWGVTNNRRGTNSNRVVLMQLPG